MMQLNPEADFNEEKALLSQISTGDEKAFSMFFHRFSAKVYTYALKIVKSETLSEEITQEVFVKIWNLGEQLNSIENLDAYLRVLTRNHTLKVLRRLALEVRTNKMMAPGYTETHNETEEYIIFKDSEKILNQGIEQLPAQQKLVYMLCHQEGLKYEEAAERLNISKLTVKTHMQHALRFLRNYVSTHTDIAVLVILMTLLAEIN
ncbi:RNA polymerase sigma-70 factor (family 1) [Pedobacter africanus]|uniref:RNA polymerase sigma-70 factor (ECF subfamily) n=1 Tax=Pedobacter africanus TaxID=151894 RepID=A0ACC6KYH6_9SPHI|nr:RNA polymerase sigma-70 factor [Pedobacter africanus]MDR6784317.1 RNA polymerase sigma-70 factor (ECF subfamily) [Pedobacter africanus]